MVRAGRSVAALARPAESWHTRDAISNVVPRKRRGRPATGVTPRVGVRLPDAVIAAIDRESESEGVGRSEIIRRAVVAYLRERGALGA